MPAPSWENLDDFLQTDDQGGFAVTATISLQAGGTRTVRGIYDDPYLNAQLGEYELDTSAPRFTTKESSLVGVGRRDTITVPGVGTLDILGEPQPDGTGMSMLKLSIQGG